MIAATPHLVATVPGRIHELRQEGAAIGWLHGSCYTITVDVGGRLVRLGQASIGCVNETQPMFALGSSGAAIWVTKKYGNTAYAYVYAQHFFAEVTGDSALPSGEYVTGVAATGSTVLYSVIFAEATDGCVGGGGPCVETVSPASYVARIVGKKRIRVPGIPPALMLAGADGRLAVVEAAPNIVHDHEVQSGAIDVYTVPGFKRVGRATMTDTILDVAVSRAALAVLTPGVVHVGSTSIPVPPDVVDISLSGRHVVYASRTSIYVDGHVVVRRGVKPLGVSISNGLIVWAEPGRATSRVYALHVR